ncbi:hypothetical protein pipiens_005410 [Culex pipiens pipiens]|uniref:Uncharacterized protein n=1 Tax=Culex pipiens pipiens TaxID=38569 RepID=A0ABD1DX16_CULPP
MFYSKHNLAGAASIDGDEKEDTAVEVLPMEKSSPAGQPVEMSTTKSDDAPLDAAAVEPPGNLNWWQKTKAWLKKHSEATKQWVAKTFHKKNAEESVGTSRPAASSEADVPGTEKMVEPAGNPGWWQKTKNWFSGLFGSKKEGGKEKEQKAEEANKS